MQSPNRLVAGAIAAGDVPPLAGYDTVTREVRVGQHSRLDLRLERHGTPDCYVEIKNCSLDLKTIFINRPLPHLFDP
ncbi:MAG: DNA/RNA nuclease SfsA [Desulfobacterales bacterium]|nr:DNA/RNA nuclease SfsA [Desulfobacterales bacterium]